MDKTNLIRTLHNNINSATSLSQLLYLSKAVEALKIGTVKTVSSYTELLTQVPVTGDVYFVENEQSLYTNIGTGWTKVVSSIGNAPLTVWGFGTTVNGTLAISGTTAVSSPNSAVLLGFSDWVHITPGSGHVIALRDNGTAWGFGDAGSGALGNNLASGTFSSPVSVVGGFTDWIRASCGVDFSIGLRRNGSIWSWGLNSNGQLGDGTTTSRLSPVSVVGGFTDWVQIEAANYHTLGIRANGTAWAWGRNNGGQLGAGNLTDRSSPVSVVGGFTDWTNVSGGTFFSAGVRANGTAWTWGENDFGQLGTGNTIGRSSPGSVIGGFTDWAQVTTGNQHTIALRANGTVWSWGRNIDGSLGTNNSTYFSSPVSVVGGFTDWVSISTVYRHNVGIRANGSAWTWGSNSNGQLGDYAAGTGKSSPVSVVGGFTDWVLLRAGRNFTLGFRA